MTQVDDSSPRADFWRSSGYHLMDRDPDGFLRVTPDFSARLCGAPGAQAGRGVVRGGTGTSRGFAGRSGAAGFGCGSGGAARFRCPRQLPSLSRIAGSFVEPRDPWKAPTALSSPNRAHRFRRSSLTNWCTPFCATSWTAATTPFACGPESCCFAPKRSQSRTAGYSWLTRRWSRPTPRLADLDPSGSCWWKPIRPMRSVELDVLLDENASIYWPRSDRFDTVLDISFAHRLDPRVLAVH